ncbi:MAG TPA: class I SAM-dependent methyltransferase [Acidobacteriaceae bacterium]|nr:class I SAM-dependent methyltransferase [Acidobacteriaceae bacterium]
MEPDTPNFDSVARAYRWMEYLSFGRMLERCRFHFLLRCSQARHALVLGDGDGRFTARLLTSNPTVKVDAVDASAAMLAVLHERVRTCCGDADTRIQTIQGDVRRFIPTRQDYDLVVSHFFLDCLTDGEVSALIARLSPCMTQDAIWLVSEFAVPDRGWRRLGARMVIRGLYFAFLVLTGLQVRKIPNHAKAFDDKGFHVVEKSAYLGGMLRTEVWQRRSN